MPSRMKLLAVPEPRSVATEESPLGYALIGDGFENKRRSVLHVKPVCVFES